MYKMKKIFLDFDNIYSVNTPPLDTIVLSSSYSSDWVVNVGKQTDCRDDAYKEFELFINNVSNINICKELYANKVSIFHNFFLPIFQWVSTIDKIITDDQMDKCVEIIFSSYSDNRKAFLIEAEGETNNTFFLYKKSYFLSFYIKEYLSNKGFTNVRFQKKYRLAHLLFYCRGMFFLHAKLLQQIFYKVFVWKRFYINAQDSLHKENIIAVSSRGIVQSQFIEGLYSYMKNKFFIFVNESTSNPFRNFNYAKKSFDSFFYSEGYIKTPHLIKEYLNVVKCYAKFSFIKKNASIYCNVSINVNDLFPEMFLLMFHMKTYSHSFVRAVETVEKKLFLNFSKIISMEMFPPFAYYIKNAIYHIPVIQIQTVAIPSHIFPNFVYSDKFYFLNQEIYDKMYIINEHFNEKFDVLHNIKYLGVIRHQKKETFNIMTYFTQQACLDEELNLVKFLSEFCKRNHLTFQVKLHPRSSANQYENLNVKLIDNTISSQDAIADSDIVVTRNSAIGLDCWYINIPVVFFVYGTLKGDNIAYIPNDYKGKISTTIDIDEFKCILNEVVLDFYKHPFHENMKVDNAQIINKILK